MKTLFIVYILINGIWFPGVMLDGWGPINYETEAICLERKAYAEESLIRLKQINPRISDKKFECVVNKS